ncbi:hypothetical protein [Nitrospira sp. Nam74]
MITRFGLLAVAMVPVALIVYLFALFAMIFTGGNFSPYDGLVVFLVSTGIMMGTMLILYTVFFFYRKLVSGSKLYCVLWLVLWSIMAAFGLYYSLSDLFTVLPVINASSHEFNVTADWVDVGSPEWEKVKRRIIEQKDEGFQGQNDSVVSTGFVHAGASILVLILVLMPFSLIVRGLSSRLRHKNEIAEEFFKDRNYSDRFFSGYRDSFIDIARFLRVYSSSRYGRGHKKRIWGIVFLALTVEVAVYSAIWDFPKPLIDLDRSVAAPLGELFERKSVLGVILWICVAELLGVVFIYLFLKLARWLRHSAQIRMIASLDAVRSDDSRKPILFLRSFQDDRISLNSAMAPFLVRILDPGSSSDSLEFLILKTLDYIGPLVCIGNPTDHAPPPGAAREYVSDTEWRNLVLRIMNDCVFIIVGVQGSHGLMWEIETIRNDRYGRKTLFLFPPKEAEDMTAVDRLLLQWGSKTVEPEISNDGTKVVGLFYGSNSHPILVTAKRITELEYDLCLRLFVSEVSPENFTQRLSA